MFITVTVKVSIYVVKIIFAHILLYKIHMTYLPIHLEKSSA